MQMPEISREHLDGVIDVLKAKYGRKFPFVKEANGVWTSNKGYFTNTPRGKIMVQDLIDAAGSGIMGCNIHIKLIAMNGDTCSACIEQSRSTFTENLRNLENYVDGSMTENEGNIYAEFQRASQAIQEIDSRLRGIRIIRCPEHVFFGVRAHWSCLVGTVRYEFTDLSLEIYYFGE